VGILRSFRLPVSAKLLRRRTSSYLDLILPSSPGESHEDWPATPPKETAAAWTVRLVPRLGLNMQGQVSFRPLVELLGTREAYF
jgi:hypothetical protein